MEKDETAAARVNFLCKVIPRHAILDKLYKLETTSISVDGKLVNALVDSGTEITVVRRDLVPGISVEGASTMYLKGIFGPAVKCQLVYVPLDIATGDQVNVVHQQVLCALAEVLVKDVLLPSDVLNVLGGVRSEKISLAGHSQELSWNSENLDETGISFGTLQEKAQDNVIFEKPQREFTSWGNEVVTVDTKDREVTTETGKGSVVTDSVCSCQEQGAELALAGKHATERKSNYYDTDRDPVHRDIILKESVGQLVIPDCKQNGVVEVTHTSTMNSHMSLGKTRKNLRNSFFWEGMGNDVRSNDNSSKGYQITQTVKTRDKMPSTPVAKPELSGQVGKADPIDLIDPLRSKVDKCVLWMVDQHTRWGETTPMTSLKDKVTCEALLSNISNTGKSNVIMSDKK
ncbi:hypothetical protein AVEN_203504-1 [Araneus ventricosus]|uniref:RNA-directed DNA polymerase n=1 Tax=Araneus ventricosus TaxID=182803 RepID=A0A4Y2BJD0_ARAVE|nr:hypothetical protein AVEN_203504-1 [Araneus ventricosus]